MAVGVGKDDNALYLHARACLAGHADNSAPPQLQTVDAPCHGMTEQDVCRCGTAFKQHGTKHSCQHGLAALQMPPGPCQPRLAGWYCTANLCLALLSLVCVPLQSG